MAENINSQMQEMIKFQQETIKSQHQLIHMLQEEKATERKINALSQSLAFTKKEVAKTSRLIADIYKKLDTIQTDHKSFKDEEIFSQIEMSFSEPTEDEIGDKEDSTA